MGTKQTSTTLPNELVEEIISRLPFPSIAKARGLSKSWRARFSPVSALEDKVTQRQVVAFQKRVQERATSWSTFYPMCLNNDFLCGYDGASQKWASLPSLSFLPQAFRSARISHWIEGALLYGMDRGTSTLYVANLLTRTWKRAVGLPRLTPSVSVYQPVSVWEASSETYKVIYLQTKGVTFEWSWYAHIYEPKSNVWSTNVIDAGQAVATSPAYLNGVLYMVHDDDVDCLLAMNVAEGTLEKLQLSLDGVFEEPEVEVRLSLVVCNGKLHMVVIEFESGKPLGVLEIDLDARRLLGVATLNGAALSGNGGMEIYQDAEPVGVSNCIFFPSAKMDPLPTSPFRAEVQGKTVAYDVRTHEWAVLDFASTMKAGFKRKHRHHLNFKWVRSSFRPGLNPFAEV